MTEEQITVRCLHTGAEVGSPVWQSQRVCNCENCAAYFRRKDRINGVFYGRRFVEAVDDLQAVISACERRAADKTRGDYGDWDDAAGRLRHLVLRKLFTSDGEYEEARRGSTEP
jgi:hypothetical protein